MTTEENQALQSEEYDRWLASIIEEDQRPAIEERITKVEDNIQRLKLLVDSILESKRTRRITAKRISPDASSGDLSVWDYAWKEMKPKQEKAIEDYWIRTDPEYRIKVAMRNLFDTQGGGPDIETGEMHHD